MQFHHVALAPDLKLTWEHLVHRCQLQLARWLYPYRPEKHYMRGPGPKCREKYLLAYEDKLDVLRLRRTEKIIGHARQSKVDKGLAYFVALHLRHHMPLMNGVRKQHACGNDG